MTSRSERSSVQPPAIELLNAQYRTAVRARERFPSERAALECLCVITRSLTDRTPPGTLGRRLYKICTDINADDSGQVPFAAACIKNR